MGQQTLLAVPGGASQDPALARSIFAVREVKTNDEERRQRSKRGGG